MNIPRFPRIVINVLTVISLAEDAIRLVRGLGRFFRRKKEPKA